MVLYIIVGILCLGDFTTFLLPVSFIHTAPGHRDSLFPHEPAQTAGIISGLDNTTWSI